jgi:putative ABC transport system substrate-binding protein
MRRREFITGCGSAVAWPLVARAQQAAMPVIGYVASGSAAGRDAFRQGLTQAGIIEGRNATVEIREASNRYELLPGLLADLIVRRKAVVIFAAGSATAVAAKAATTSIPIPIVFGMGEDPISLGLVQSLNHPGGNITGVAYLNSAVVPKRLELLHEVVPQVRIVAALINPRSPNAEISAKDAQEAARTLGLEMHLLNASTSLEIDMAFERLVELKAGALLIAPDGLFNANASQIAVLAARHGIAASHEFRVFPDVGGLMSYGGGNLDGARQAGIYVGRILKREKPADLPVQQITKIDLIINLKTAKALGLTIPERLLATADEVIQ